MRFSCVTSAQGCGAPRCASVADNDAPLATPTFAAAFRDALAATGVSQKELSRRLAGTKETTRESEAKRSQILKWLRGRHEPEIASAREVEEALGLPEGHLQALIQRKPRGRPAALSRDQQIADLREELAAVRAEVAGLSSDLAALREAQRPRHEGPRQDHAASGDPA